jgi:hypothetical protein
MYRSEPLTPPCSIPLFGRLLGVAACFGAALLSGRELSFHPGNFEQAQDAARAVLRDHPGEPLTVWLEPGAYYLAAPLRMAKPDSGTADAPVVWRARQPGTVTLSVGRQVQASQFTPVTDATVLARLDSAARDHVVQLDLGALGLRNTKPYPNYFTNDTHLLRVFCGGDLMPNARWPNGPQGYTTMQGVLDSGDFRSNQSQGGTFRYRGDRPERWVAAVGGGGVWLRGFWRVPWVIEGLRVKEIDVAQKTITFAVSTANGIGSKYTPLVNGTRAGDGTENWYVLNLLEEIDEPGEWAIDFERNQLYFWPPTPVADGSVVIADERRSVITFNNASHLVFRDLTLRHSLGSGVTLSDGEGVVLGGLRICDHGEHGVLLRGGYGHSVHGCDIHDVGLSGVDLLAGERKTLTPSRHRIVNNHIHRIGLAAPVAAIVAGYGPRAEVVGNQVLHNRIHDGPSAGVRFAGNDNEFAWNEVYRIGMDSSDLGAFYTNSGWTTQGNRLHHNFVHHNENAQAFYLDDGDSGDSVYRNIVYKAQSGAFVGGGHDNLFQHNVFIASERGIHVDARGTQRGYHPRDSRLGGDLNSVPFRSPPWSERYPNLTQYPDMDTTIPSNIVFADNLVVDCAVDIRQSGPPAHFAGVTFGPLAHGTMDLFRDPAQFDFGFADLARVRQLLPGFPEIPVERIGIHVDEYRRSVPPRDLEQLRTESTRKRAFDSQQDIDASNVQGAVGVPFISEQEKDYARVRDQAPAPGAATRIRELSFRGGLPRFTEMVKEGKPVTIAYFGGSITAHDGWRALSFAALQTLYPRSALTMVNASVGGTGSIVGVFRADNDLVVHRPDLVFIEFAVNDGRDANERPNDVIRALEGIIRKVRLANPGADICLVYTMQTAHLEAVRAGRAHAAVALHERVAAWYHIPTIHVGPAVVAMVDAGTAVFAGKVVDKVTGRDAEGRLVITEDNTHPVIPTGHALYADVVMRAMRELGSSSNWVPTPLPEPMLGASWELAKTIPAVGHAQFSGDWQAVTAADGASCMRFGKRFYSWFPHMARTTVAGSSVSVRFRGTVVGIKGLEGPDSAIVEIAVNDKPPFDHNRFTVYCTRHAYIGDALPELPYGEHTVTWTLSAKRPDKQKILASYYRPDNDRDLRENPARYAGLALSVGELMLIGELLPVADGPVP